MADEKITLSKEELSKIVEGAVQSALENLIKARAQAPASKALRVAKKCLGIANAGLREAGKTLLASSKEIVSTIKSDS